MTKRITCKVVPQQLAIYLGKRDFVDHVDMVDPIGQWVQKGNDPWEKGNGSQGLKERQKEGRAEDEAN